jgi:hypothetical protein
MLLRRFLLVGFSFLMVPLSVDAETRDEEDRADAARRCGLPRAASMSHEEHAIRCAEWFIAEQGYTTHGAVTDINKVVSEGIEWGASRREWLAQRRGTLEPKAFALCALDGRSYVVAFRTKDKQNLRGVSLDENFGSLRVQHSDVRDDIIGREGSPCRKLS